jgi:hypothetical protein|tara:strand:+ start:638 stop:1213 length:576 start_codon:yes stop_codon:yes gene_type:complete
MIQKVKINTVFPNVLNPRTIKKGKFEKLVKSIKEFPEMLELRPIIVNSNMDIIGGNMRFKACQELGLKEVYIIKAENLTKEQVQQFIIKDNVGFGEWDWDILANTWDTKQLTEWGMDVWQPEEEVDYSILEDDDLSEDLSEMKSGVRKAIQIEFHLEHYEEASELVRFWRNKGAYVGSMIMEYLKEEKNKL